MLTALPSSTRSIRGYVCISCLSSALFHHELFVPHNVPRYFSSKTVKSSSTDSSSKATKITALQKEKLRSQRKLRKPKVGTALKRTSKAANGKKDADKDVNDAEEANGGEDTKSKTEAGSTLAVKGGRKTSKVLHTIRAAQKKAESKTEGLEKTADGRTKEDDETLSPEESGATKKGKTNVTMKSKLKNKLPVAKKPVAKPKSKAYTEKPKEKTALAYLEEIEACSGSDKLKKRNAVISRAPLQALVKLMQSGKLDDSEKALAEMFLKVRMSVRKLDVKPFENVMSEEIAGKAKDALPGAIQKTFNLSGVGKTPTEVGEGEENTTSTTQKSARSTSSKRRVSKIDKVSIRRIGSSDNVKRENTEEDVPRRGISRRNIPKSLKMGPTESVDPDSLQLIPLEKEMLPVPGVSYGLDRVLFNPGVYSLRDPRSRTFNFDPYLESIMPVTEFDFNALKEYITSSRDTVLISAANEEKKKYTGSTSSMGAALAHFHFLLSQWRPINTGSLSKSFHASLTTFSAMQRTPSAIFLRWRDGVYAIDADKQFDTANILMMLGKSMEKLLTLPTDDFEKYRKINSEQISEEERNETESYHYTTMGDFLMRSQLDAYDPRLPGTGMFDLKTRAVVSVRMDAQNYTLGMDYEIRSRNGNFESYEREYYDMIRSAFLKYSLQVRMGRMDGIFVAYHNTQRIFGFQYISLSELDYTLHGTYDTTIGDSEFKLSVDLLNKVLDRATAKFPKQSLRLHIDTRGLNMTDQELSVPITNIYAEPVTEEQIEGIQQSNRAEVEAFERRALGMRTEKEPLRESIDENNVRVEAEAGLDDGEIDDAVLAEASSDKQDTLGIEIDTEGKEVATDSAYEDYLEDDSYLEDEEQDEIDASKLMLQLDESEEIDESDDVEELEPVEEEDPDSNEHLAADQQLESEEAEQTKVPLENIEQPDENNDTQVDASGARVPNDIDIEKPAEIAILEDEAEKPLQDYYTALARNFREEANYSPVKEDNDSEKAGPSYPPLLVMTLTVQNKVNGKDVKRPENLTSKDKWTIDYCLSEVKSEREAQDLYDKCKRRRMLSFDNAGANKSSGLPNEYVMELRELSKKGKEWRKQQDELDRVAKLKVYGVAESDSRFSKRREG